MCAENRPSFTDIVVTLERIEREREKTEAPVILGEKSIIFNFWKRKYTVKLLYWDTTAKLIKRTIAQYLIELNNKNE